MTRSRSILAAIATTTSLLALPAISHASPAAALESCVKAFMSTNFADKQPAKVVHLDSTPSAALSVPRTYSYVLTAKGIVSGKRYAQSMCTTDGAGTVTIEAV